MRLTCVILAFGGTQPAYGEFSAHQRSINGTGEVLAPAEVEAGLLSLAIGLPNDWQITTPSVAGLVGFGKLELRHRVQTFEAQRLSPYLGLATPRHLHAGADYGWDFGKHREHSVTVGAKLRYGPLAKPGGDGRVGVRAHSRVLPNAEYDYYADGDVSYVGISDYLPYAGHTWAFTSVHVGLIFSPQAGFIPLPYVYWRF